MVSATTMPNFALHGLFASRPPKRRKTNPPILLPTPQRSAFTLFHYPYETKIHSRMAPVSVDVSKEDNPLDNDPSPPVETEEKYEAKEKLDRRRLEERFVVLNTGVYECRSCGYRYDEAVGDPLYPIPPGLGFGKLPEDWRCPTCGAAQSFFVSKSVEIAGFAQNQGFGFGTNSLTSGQKALLIYGSLLLAFALFLSGYFLQ